MTEVTDAPGLLPAAIGAHGEARRVRSRGQTDSARSASRHGARGIGASAVRIARDAALTLAGIAGVVAVAWAVASLFFGFSLITFATGSMAPSIPTGSLAVVREVPASELKIGDVTTLQRAGERLPVTHRITGIDSDPRVPDGRIVSMQGDANPVPDLFPYHVTTGKVVLVSLPGGQQLIEVLISPVTLGLLTLGAGALVFWAFWPREAKVRRHAR